MPAQYANIDCSSSRMSMIYILKRIYQIKYHIKIEPYHLFGSFTQLKAMLAGYSFIY